MLGMGITEPAQAAAPVSYTCNHFFPLSYVGPNAPWGFGWECAGLLGPQDRISFTNAPPWAAHWCRNGYAGVGTDGVMRVSGYGCI